jgi:hypothetical protein
MGMFCPIREVTVAVADVSKWIPVEYGGALFKKFTETSVLFRIANGPGGRVEPMSTNTKHVPKDGDVAVQFTGKNQTYGLDTTAVDDILLTSKKMTGGVPLAEEDISDAAGFVQVVPAKRDAAFRGFATLLDNAAFAVTGTPTTDPDMTVPYNSLYRQVKAYAGGANVLTWDASSGTAAELRTAILAAMGVAENSEWASTDLVWGMNPAFRAYLRNQTVDGSNGLPIWSQAENTILSYRVEWGRGLRTSATAVQKPTSGNPIAIVGPPGMIVPGTRDALSWRVTDSETGIGALSDTAYVLARQRLGFNIGDPSAFAIVEIVP